MKTVIIFSSHFVTFLITPLLAKTSQFVFLYTIFNDHILFIFLKIVLPDVKRMKAYLIFISIVTKYLAVNDNINNK